MQLNNENRDIIMKKTRTIVALLYAVGCILVLFASCRDMSIDTEQRRAIIEGMFPIDTVDKFHQWDLLQSKTVTVRTDIENDNISRVQLLSGNPYEQEDVEILAEKFAQVNDNVTLTAEIAKTESTIYAAAVNRKGKYYVVPTKGQGSVNFSGNNVVSSGTLHEPTYQMFTYLFEEDYPLPGDFDFNDVVLRINKSTPSANMMVLTVTLAAVGSQTQLAAAIRLKDVDFDDVAEVNIAEKERFDEDYPIERYYIDNDQVYVRGLDGSLIINLFEDAHWVLNPVTENGFIKRVNINSRRYEKENESAIVPTKTRTYTVLLKDGKTFDNSLSSMLDPFIIENNGGLNMEVHTYRYKYDEAIWHYTNGPGDEDDHVAWALLIPDSKFMYPVEEIPIGRYRNGEIYGAYSRYNHSFGQWGRDCEKSLDWWKYPTKAQVYY